MRRLTGQLLRGVADLVDPRRLPPPRAQMLPEITRETLFVRDDDRAAARREDAASMLDDDVLGYVLVRAVRVGACATMELGIALEDWLWPSMGETLGRIVLEADRVHSER